MSARPMLKKSWAWAGPVMVRTPASRPATARDITDPAPIDRGRTRAQAIRIRLLIVKPSGFPNLATNEGVTATGCRRAGGHASAVSVTKGDYHRRANDLGRILDPRSQRRFNSFPADLLAEGRTTKVLSAHASMRRGVWQILQKPESSFATSADRKPIRSSRSR